jgi:hypothetical protein
VVIAIPYLVGHAYRIRDLLDHDNDIDEPQEDRRDVATVAV